jgi:hypothetical protein
MMNWSEKNQDMWVKSNGGFVPTGRALEFRPVPPTLRQETCMFHPARQEQRPKLSDSLLNSPRPVNPHISPAGHTAFSVSAHRFTQIDTDAKQDRGCSSWD